MNNTDEQFKKLANEILTNGHEVNDRTGVGTKSIFGHQMRFKMSEGFPLFTLRKIHLKSVIHELLWFLGSFDEKWDRFGNTNIRYLLDNGCTFWSEWPYTFYDMGRKYRPELPKLTLKEFEEKIKEDDKFAIDFGGIGPGYGKQWLNCGGDVERTRNEDGGSSFKVIQGINQIEECIQTLKKNPDSRRVIVDSWNPIDLPEMLLPPCHMFFQFKSYKMTPLERVEEFKKEYLNTTQTIKELNFPERKLSIQMYIRSQDCYLGWPFNVSEYALLLHLVSQVVNMIPDELVYTIGDAHLYNNSIEATKIIIERDSFPLPTLKLNKNIESIYDFRYDDIVIENYQSHSNIKVDVAV